MQQAMQLYTKAAEGIKLFHRRSICFFLCLSALAGHLAAHVRLGSIFEHGCVDEDKEHSGIERAARKDALFLSPPPVPVDCKAALNWYNKAAERGYLCDLGD